RMSMARRSPASARLMSARIPARLRGAGRVHCIAASLVLASATASAQEAGSDAATEPLTAPSLRTTPAVQGQATPREPTPPPVRGETATLAPITVSAAMMEQDLFDAAASVDRVEGHWLRAATMQVDLSERLDRVPGLLVRDRQNYA